MAFKAEVGLCSNIYCDAANPVVWQAIKREADEPFDEKTVREKKAYAIKNKLVSLSVKVKHTFLKQACSIEAFEHGSEATGRYIYYL